MVNNYHKYSSWRYYNVYLYVVLLWIRIIRLVKTHTIYKCADFDIWNAGSFNGVVDYGIVLTFYQNIMMVSFNVMGLHVCQSFRS